jgi:hypothetical protein
MYICNHIFAYMRSFLLHVLYTIWCLSKLYTDKNVKTTYKCFQRKIKKEGKKPQVRTNVRARVFNAVLLARTQFASVVGDEGLWATETGYPAGREGVCHSVGCDVRYGEGRRPSSPTRDISLRHNSSTPWPNYVVFNLHIQPLIIQQLQPMDSWTLKAAIMCHEALNLLFTKECY